MELPINLMAFVLAVVLTSLITLITFFLLKNLKQSRYDLKLQRAELESFRRSLEDKMYSLNDRLILNESRWQDVNHLIIDSQSKVRTEYGNSNIRLTNFLRSNGIDEEDTIVDNKLIFVLTPFHNRFIDDYFIIKRICDSVDFKCSRGDEEYFSSDIFSHILRQIVKSRLIIANINGRNPNVLYELGIAQAMDKPVILLSKTPNDIPIDIRTKKFIIYNNEIELEKNLKLELIRILNNSKKNSSKT